MFVKRITNRIGRSRLGARHGNTGEVGAGGPAMQGRIDLFWLHGGYMARQIDKRLTD
jgi:hypothetical protein